jgi:ABC-2 type transport system ATP-binding protein
MVEIRDLQKMVDGHTVLSIEELTVASGEIAALVGPSGSGAEALFELLLGRPRPTAGSVRLAGLDPGSDKAGFSQAVGVLFADDTLYKNQKALAYLKFQSRLYGLPKARAREVLEQVGLADQANVRVEKLPSGLKRRLAFGRAILHRPQILILDDPFANCDESSIALLAGLIRRRAGDTAAILILADNEAQLTTLCDVIYTLEGGRITSVSRPAEEQEATLPFKIPVKLEDSVALVNPADILYALTQDGRTYLQTADERLPTQFTMIELEERLARSGFFRAHRGYLVNLQHVTEVIPFTRSSYSLRLDDAEGSLIPLSKEAARELRELLGY